MLQKYFYWLCFLPTPLLLRWTRKELTNKLLIMKLIETMWKPISPFKLIVIFAIFSVISIQQTSLAANQCGSLEDGYGPFDYNDPKNRQGLSVVERRHFTPKVENLISGESTSSVLADLDYTLRHYPNHHRALLAVTKYELREIQRYQQQNKIYVAPVGHFPQTADCYFNRAIRWRPNDPNVYLIQGIYLQLKGDLDTALKAYKKSESIQPNSADLQYNLGLLYFEKKQYALAKNHAKKAYQLGYPLLGLRHKLTVVGHWP